MLPLRVRAGSATSNGITGWRGEDRAGSLWIPARYEFLIAERLSGTVRDAFPELVATPGPVGGTVPYGPVRDASELHELLARLARCGVQVIEMRRLPD